MISTKNPKVKWIKLITCCLFSAFQVTVAAQNVPANYNKGGYNDLIVGIPKENIDNIIITGAEKNF